MSADQKKQMQEIISALNDISEETAIPKNVKLKIQVVIATLQDKKDVSIRISKALNGLEEIADDVNMEPYVRTQIWSVVSLLEKAV